ncbi:serine hydrolase domain-containing protein [Niabella aurantiaca]|uniref:serine hydrolase domain-containing protein n=1 Tax=Niabella aurantiaca TaxID=379900 RepID=UPI0012FCA8EA|nr:serine hydrolase [Niabella aurantiaca]
MSILLFVLLSLIRCTKNDDLIPITPDTSMYFPANTGSDWETTSATQLGWNTTAIEDLKTFLAQKNTKSFMILVNGRIVMEEYFNGHTASTDWEWNSAGKTLVSVTTGIAQQENLLNINNRVSDYLESGWTNMPLEKENMITVRNLLTMTSGISSESQLVIHNNLTYVADAGTRWAYSNVFQLLIDVDAKASNSDFETYFNEKLKNKIGMEGFWNFGVIFKIYHSNTRSMARFGLLALSKGRWKDEQIVNENYFNESTNTSQNTNPSYGYLWWLNGKSKYMVPGSQDVFQGALIPNAPSDMFAALGASDQKLYIIPSKKMVIVRMGDSADPNNPAFATSGFDNALWAKINAVIN